jgi:hypothetical protein
MNIVAFYLGYKPDHAGRMITDIWQFEPKHLENIHDYIQILFPLREPSRFHEEAPLLTDEIISQFKEGPDSALLKRNLLISYRLMLDFYNLRLDYYDPYKVVIQHDDFDGHWVTQSNHNFWRVTRILTCLDTLGCEQYAKGFLTFLTTWLYDEYKGIISPLNLEYWRQAVREN